MIDEDYFYIINKRRENQKRYFICSCCNKHFDFGDSVDYAGAVRQWEQFGRKCYACFHGYCRHDIAEMDSKDDK